MCDSLLRDEFLLAMVNAPSNAAQVVSKMDPELLPHPGAPANLLFGFPGPRSGVVEAVAH